MTLYKNFDDQIEQYKAKIEELEALKVQQEKQLEGIEAYKQAVAKIAQEYRISERDMLLPKQSMIFEWISDMGKSDNPPQLYRDLESYFSRKLKPSKPAKKAKANGSDEIKVPTGLYINPETGLSVEKKKRSPRILLDWISEYGVERVVTWHQASNG